MAAPLVECSPTDLLEALIDAAGWQAETFVFAEEIAARLTAPSPSCLILDVLQPGLNGLEVQRRLTARADLPIVFIAGRSDVTTVVQAMKCGAVDFLQTPFVEAAVRRAIGVALERSRAVQHHAVQAQRLQTLHGALTPREREVMAAVVSGLLNKQIAGELGISEITVKAHRGQVMRKMRAGSVAELVTMAVRLGIAHPFGH